MPKINPNLPKWALFGGIAVVVLFIYTKGKSSSSSSNTSSSGGTSVVDASNSPMAPVMSMGHIVPQNIPDNQLTPNEPGTAPILSTDSGPQYG